MKKALLMWWKPFIAQKMMFSIKNFFSKCDEIVCAVFGAKGLFLRAVVISNFTYYSSKEICDYMENLFHADTQKLYLHFPVEDTINLRSAGWKPIKIPGCVSNLYHMLYFNPEGSILAKINICSCTEYLEGKFLIVLSKKDTLAWQMNLTYLAMNQTVMWNMKMMSLSLLMMKINSMNWDRRMCCWWWNLEAL